MKQVTITKGEHKGVIAYVTSDQKEEIGNERIYKLQDRSGNQLWNDNFAWFPESFVEI